MVYACRADCVPYTLTVHFVVPDPTTPPIQMQVEPLARSPQL